MRNPKPHLVQVLYILNYLHMENFEHDWHLLSAW